MRHLQSSEIDAVVGGGLLSELIKALGLEVAISLVKDLYSQVGVAGPGANETDNGGSSYGIDVCNTFGCPGTFISEAERERLRGAQL